MLDLSTYRITGTRVSQGLGGRLFKYGTVIFITNRGAIQWRAVKSPWDLRRFFEETTHIIQHEEYLKNVGVEEAVKKATSIALDQQYGYLPRTGPYLTQNQNMVGNTPQQQLPQNPTDQPNKEMQQTIFCSFCEPKITLAPIIARPAVNSYSNPRSS